MTSKSNVIELNGRSYDALTGAMLGSAKRPEHHVRVAAIPAKQAPRASHNTSHGTSAVSMDGFVHYVKPVTPKTPASHISAHQPQPTKTLMRRTVSAPHTAKNTVKTPALRSQSQLRPGVPHKVAVAPKLSSTIVDPFRQQRAAGTNRSALVNHFVSPKAALNTMQRPAAQPAPAVGARPMPQRPTFNSNPALASGIKNNSRVALNQIKPQQPAKAKQSPTQSAVTNNSYEDQDIFEQALAHATSHLEKSPKESKMSAAKRGGKKHRKLLGFAASAAAFVLMCGFVAYQNKANIQLQLASAKAGFSASVPLYKPSGYALGKLAYSPGAVAMAYQNSATNAGFNVTQKKSNWDSQTLLENFVATTNQPYQGYESAGRTIYVYGQGKATWVNGGIWYQIDGADTLTNDQIVKVAASM